MFYTILVLGGVWLLFFEKELHKTIFGYFSCQSFTKRKSQHPLFLDIWLQAGMAEPLTTVRRTMPGLLNFFDEAKSVFSSLSDLPIDPNALKALCLAW